MSKNSNINKDGILYTIWDWVKTIAIALIITILVKMFIIDATMVSGKSMLNTLHDGDILLVNKIGTHFSDFDRGDIIILRAPDAYNKLYVKRIIGEEGDRVSIKDGSVYVNDEELSETYTSFPETTPSTEESEWVLGEDQYFVMGDNRIPGASNDSRRFGPISKDNIVGHAFLRFYPFNSIGLIDNDPYVD
ncbi:MAG: signal peptidase I [Anaerococcus sp.]|nr:signal peptidase I [Anaerococcus sp.]MDD7045220.1 signal peptidase I [Peptoniphilaceae bacterium]MDY2918421.1 signal peptidase I [Anaerococcus sp.]